MGAILISWQIITLLFVAGLFRDASSIVKSDTSTTSSNHIRVSDGSDSSTNSTKADGVIVATTTATEPPTKPVEVKNPQLNREDTVSADYAEIEEEEEEEDKSKQKQIGGTLQSTADSTLSTVSSFNSSTMRDSTMRDSTLRDSSLRFSTMTDSTMGDGTLLYVGGQNSYLDNLEPGAHNTPRFPIASVATGSQYDHLALNKDYEKDPSYIPDHDYEQDPDYQKQKRDFNPPLPPAHLYQALQQQAAARNDIHYRAPERNLRPISEKLPHSLEQQPDYADAIPHYNSLSSRQAHNYDYAKLRASTLDPLPHYTHLDIKTKENVRGSGLSYVTTDL